LRHAFFCTLSYNLQTLLKINRSLLINLIVRRFVIPYRKSGILLEKITTLNLITFLELLVNILNSKGNLSRRVIEANGIVIEDDTVEGLKMKP
ncbi:MAG: hypothetical protein OXC02_05895, partial [Rhodobacteraceae bacterium]|nr:hypothetical protein [Paracoccaceae bacterium]